MLMWITEWLSSNWSHAFNAFSYISLRGALALLTSLFIGLLFGPWFIRTLTCLKYEQMVRDDGPATHKIKQGTPTMGGLLILFSWLSSTLLWADLSVSYIWVAVLTTLCFGWIGWMDDWRKIVHKNPKGLSAKEKMFWQSLMTIIAGALLLCFTPVGDHTLLIIPFFKNVYLPIGFIGFMVMFYFVVVGTSNGVNLTDGLDGLAIVPSIMVAAGLGVFAYVTGNAVYAKYLSYPFMLGTGELVIFLSALMGAGLAFLWFNAHPARIFMGDVGALAIGAGLGVVAMIIRQELALFIMCGVFVVESLSVMLQVGVFKYTRKKTGTGVRVFLMAPLHHHFEQKGIPETQVVVRFWIAAFACVLLALSLLKLR